MNERNVGHRGGSTYWIVTVIAAAAFAFPGVANLVHANHIARDMANLGYPPYFMTILGVWKLLAAFAIVAPRLPRLKEWAYAGMIFDLTGAAASRAAMHDGVAMIAVPLLIGLVVIASWALRPEPRTLKPFPWRSKVPKPLSNTA